MHNRCEHWKKHHRDIYATLYAHLLKIYPSQLYASDMIFKVRIPIRCFDNEFEVEIWINYVFPNESRFVFKDEQTPVDKTTKLLVRLFDVDPSNSFASRYVQNSCTLSPSGEYCTDDVYFNNRAHLHNRDIQKIDSKMLLGSLIDFFNIVI